MLYFSRILIWLLSLVSQTDGWGMILKVSSSLNNSVIKHWHFYEQKSQNGCILLREKLMCSSGWHLLALRSKAGVLHSSLQSWRGPELSKTTTCPHTGEVEPSRLECHGLESPTLQQTRTSAACSRAGNASLKEMWVIAQRLHSKTWKYTHRLSVVFLWQSIHPCSDPKFLLV